MSDVGDSGVQSIGTGLVEVTPDWCFELAARSNLGIDPETSPSGTIAACEARPAPPRHRSARPLSPALARAGSQRAKVAVPAAPAAAAGRARPEQAAGVARGLQRGRLV
jgi:hypothetical protein